MKEVCGLGVSRDFYSSHIRTLSKTLWLPQSYELYFLICNSTTYQHPVGSFTDALATSKKGWDRIHLFYITRGFKCLPLLMYLSVNVYSIHSHLQVFFAHWYRTISALCMEDIRSLWPAFPNTFSQLRSDRWQVLFLGSKLSFQDNSEQAEYSHSSGFQ